MKYILMALIVLGLVLADFATGIIKAYITDDLSSAKMRKGGMNKLCEMIVMAAACGLEIGIERLGAYYQAAELAEIAGALAAISVFGYITIMELISILENYATISPDAVWVRKIINKLRNMKEGES